MSPNRIVCLLRGNQERRPVDTRQTRFRHTLNCQHTADKGWTRPKKTSCKHQPPGHGLEPMRNKKSRATGEDAQPEISSVSASAQDDIVAFGKAHTRSTPSLSSLPKIALETVPIFVCLNTDRSRPWRVECQPLPFSTPLSFRRSIL